MLLKPLHPLQSLRSQAYAEELADQEEALAEAEVEAEAEAEAEADEMHLGEDDDDDEERAGHVDHRTGSGYAA